MEEHGLFETTSPVVVSRDELVRFGILLSALADLAHPSRLQRAFCMTKPAFALRYIVPVLVYATWVRYSSHLSPHSVLILLAPFAPVSPTQAICIMLVWTGALRNFMLIAGSAFNCQFDRTLQLGDFDRPPVCRLLIFSRRTQQSPQCRIVSYATLPSLGTC